jgi:Domain of unknown function (DUF4328)
MATQLGADGPAWARPYRSARPLAVVATILLSLTIVYSVLVILAVEGAFAFLADTGLADPISAALAVGAVLLSVLDAATFLFWFRRAYRNLPALGAQGLEWSPRSAVLWWFVPLANLIVPLLIASDIWKASDSTITPNTRQGRATAKFPSFLIPWWVAWWVAWVTRGIRSSSTDVGIFALLTLPLILAAALAMFVIWKIQLRQDTKSGRHSQQSKAAFFPGPVTSGGSPRSRWRLPALVIGLVGLGCAAVAGIVLLVTAFMHAAANCPPQDFPVYPNAQQTDFNYTVSTGTSDCTAGWESDAAPNDVATFYDAGLASGPWQLVTKDEQSGEWSFQRRGDSSTIGRIRFLGHGTQTRIEMEVMTGQSPDPSPSASVGASTVPIASVASSEGSGALRPTDYRDRYPLPNHPRKGEGDTDLRAHMQAFR